MSNNNLNMTKRLREFYRVKKMVIPLVSPDDKRTYHEGFMAAMNIITQVPEGKIDDTKSYEEWFHKEDQ